MALLLGMKVEKDAPGEVSHFRALCSALSGTVGMGNVAGVAVAITQGGPGAIFWMWVCASSEWRPSSTPVRLLSCTEEKMRMEWSRADLCISYAKGLGRNGNPWLSSLLHVGCLDACLFLQSNQLTQIVNTMFFEPQGWFVGSESTAQVGNALFGLLLAVLVGIVVVGGIKRIGAFAARLVPGMVLLYGGDFSSDYFTPCGSNTSVT